MDEYAKAQAISPRYEGQTAVATGNAVPPRKQRTLDGIGEAVSRLRRICVCVDRMNDRISPTPSTESVAGASGQIERIPPYAEQMVRLHETITRLEAGLEALDAHI